MKKHSFTILSLLTLLSLLLTGCAGSQATPPLEPSSQTAFNPLVSATGVIVPAQWATVAIPAGGLLVAVPVQEGAAVTAGQVLARIDGQEAAQATLAAARHELANAQHDLADLKDNAPVLAAQAQQAQADAAKALKDAQDNRYRKNLARVSQATIDQTQADLIIAKDKLKDEQENFDKYVYRQENDLERAQAFSMLAAAQQKVDQIQWNLDWLIGRPDPLEVNQADAAIRVAQANLADAQQRYDKVKNGPDALDLAKAQALVDSAQANILSAQAVLNKLELHAPFAGVVSTLKVRQGEWVSPGTPVLLLADMASLRVETTDLNEIDAARVSLDDPVKVTLDALPGVELGGRVARISPKSEEGSGVNYTVVVELKNPPAELRWGMTAFVDIEVEK